MKKMDIKYESESKIVVFISLMGIQMANIGIDYFVFPHLTILEKFITYYDSSRVCWLQCRKFLEKMHPMCCNPHFIDGDSEFHSSELKLIYYIPFWGSVIFV